MQIELNKVYKCLASLHNVASIHVVSGSITLAASNVVKYDENHNLIVPLDDELTQTDDVLGVGMHLLSGLPEWISFRGNGEVWVKNCINTSFIQGDK